MAIEYGRHLSVSDFKTRSSKVSQKKEPAFSSAWLHDNYERSVIQCVLCHGFSVSLDSVCHCLMMLAVEDSTCRV